MFLDQFLFELSCKNLHTWKHTHMDAHKYSSTLYYVLQKLTSLTGVLWTLTRNARITYEKYRIKQECNTNYTSKIRVQHKYLEITRSSVRVYQDLI